MTAARTAWEVLAIRYGTREATRGEVFHRWEAYGEPDGPLRMDYFFWLLRDADRVVVVDTGFDPVAAERRGRTSTARPDEVLRGLGIDPASVGTVIVTHLHYDHIGNLSLFPEAELVVAERELAFWTGPLAAREQFAAHVIPAEVDRVAAALRSGRLRTVDTELEPVAGVRVVRVGGHSPGQLIVRVATPGGETVLASDALHYYEELERDRPCAVLIDLEDAYRALDTLRELAAAGHAIVAGHDPLVTQRFPSVEGALSGIAYRVG
jgi:glyoxylase-like metal-dependent hydrolase (beta-lactamase superfamily II)